MFDFFVQCLGILGAICTIIALQFNKHFWIIFFKTLSELLFAVQLVFLGSYTGAVMNVISVIRNVIFVYAVKKNKPVLPWILAFSSFALITGVTTAVLSWNTTLQTCSKFGNEFFVMFFTILISILPIFGKIITTFAYACKDPHKLRMLNLPSLTSWLIHDIIIFSIAGISNNLFGIVSAIIAEIRYKKIKNKNDLEPSVDNAQD
ncbi:MAG: YgjV family protein [Clostridiales bacterium]|nr:YgjV family protein [Clostridiales bacterium]